jgi:hypothetical protein
MPGTGVRFELLDELGVGFLPGLVFLPASLSFFTLTTFTLGVSATDLDGPCEFVEAQQNLRKLLLDTSVAAWSYQGSVDSS